MSLTETIETLTAHEFIPWHGDIDTIESILAARAAGGPTLADARTPESEDTE